MAWCKMMPRGVGIISTPGQAIFENSLLDTIFEPLLTFVGSTNSWPPRPRIGPTNRGQQRFNKGSKNASKSQAVLGSVHVQGQSRSSDGATAWTRPRPGPSTILGHKFDRGAVPSLLLSAGCWICTTPDKKTWTDNRISDFPDISDIVDFRHFYKSIWDQDQS